jgi:hypothetical protein
MAVDARINSISTQVTARDPALADDPQFVAMIVSKVLAEIDRTQEERRRRDADRRPSRSGQGDRRGGR